MKKVIGILVNDVHLDKDNGELVKDIFRQVVELCHQVHCKRIFCGGDIFTNRSGQPLSCLTDWKAIIETIEENDLEIHLIPGNHDKTDPDDLRSYLDVYTDDCCHLYRQGKIEMFDQVLVAFVPYFNDDAWMAEMEEVNKVVAKKRSRGAIDENTKKILITHRAFDGVRNNDGSLVSSPVKPSMFEDWDKVLVGHYHNASQVGDNIIYTGSAYQNNYGETVCDKGFTLIFNDATIKHVESQFPRYIKEVVRAVDKERLMKLLEVYKEHGDDHIRFIFTGKKDECQSINIAEIRGKYGIDCKFLSTEEKEAIDVSEDDSVLCFDKRTIQKEYFKYCSENSIKGEKMKYGLELIKSL